MRGHLFTRDAAVTTCSTTIVSITLPPFQQFLTSVIIMITSILQRSFKFTNHLTIMKSCVTKWYIFHTRVIISFSSFYLFCLFIFQFYLSTNASIIPYCCYIGFWSVINTSRFRISWKQSRCATMAKKRLGDSTGVGSIRIFSRRIKTRFFKCVRFVPGWRRRHEGCCSINTGPNSWSKRKLLLRFLTR